MSLLLPHDHEGARALAKAMFESSTGLPELRSAYADAMWAWASVEGELLMVHLAATHAYMGNFKAFQHAYFSIVSARTRLDMTNAAAKAFWADTEHHKPWQDLADRCRKSLARRGSIAHLQGQVIFPDEGKTHQKPVALLLQHVWHPDYETKFGPLKSKGITAEGLRGMQSEWEQLAKDLHSFSNPIIDAGMTTFSNLLGSARPSL